MRNIRLNLLLCLFIISSVHVYCQKKESHKKPGISTPEEILLIDSTINLYEAGDFFISGQPNDSILKALKHQELGLIINVRTPEEMIKIKEEGFDEAAVAHALDIAYVNIPIGGSYGFTSTSIKEINDAILSNEGKVMIHCGSAGRATNALLAWLINYDETSVNDAISLGRKMQLRFYLEDLLGYELSFDKK